MAEAKKKDKIPLFMTALNGYGTRYNDKGKTFKNEEEAREFHKKHPGSRLYPIKNHDGDHQKEENKVTIGWLVTLDVITDNRWRLDERTY